MFAYNLSPVFGRAASVDKIFDVLGNTGSESAGAPAYDIVKLAEDEFRITVAVPGFKPSQINIETRADSLVVEATPASSDESISYIHRGRPSGGLRRAFQLGEHVSVVGARLEDGLLHVEMKREVPPALASRKIEIQSAQAGEPGAREAA